VDRIKLILDRAVVFDKTWAHILLALFPKLRAHFTMDFGSDDQPLKCNILIRDLWIYVKPSKIIVEAF